MNVFSPLTAYLLLRQPCKYMQVNSFWLHLVCRNGTPALHKVPSLLCVPDPLPGHQHLAKRLHLLCLMAGRNKPAAQHAGPDPS